MRLESTDWYSILGTPLFFLALLSFALFLVSLIPVSRRKGRFLRMVAGLVVATGLLAEVGVIWMGWEPPWQEQGIQAVPASPFEILLLPALACLLLGFWYFLSVIGLASGNERLKFRVGPAFLLVFACLAYEAGMIFFHWPAP